MSQDGHGIAVSADQDGRRFRALDPAGRHQVQFYASDASLAGEAADFLSAGLTSGGAALIVATEAHWHLIRQQLAGYGHDTVALDHQGRCRWVDAHQLLSSMLINGMPDWRLFKRHIGDALGSVRATSVVGGIRVFGEMVDILWQEQRHEAALCLEEYWNDFCRLHPFFLLCAYAQGHFHQSDHDGLFIEVCQAHALAPPVDGHGDRIGAEAVASLERRHVALELEIERHKQTVHALLEAITLREDSLAVASHELKTPLTAIQLNLGSIQLMAQSQLDPALNDRLERAIAHVSRMGGLIDNLLDSARIRTGQLSVAVTACDLAAVVQDVVERVQPVARGLQCPLTVTVPGPVLGHWDPQRLDQVVTNLLANAMKYGRGQPIAVTLATSAAGVELRVEDHGGGIAAADLAQLFTRFGRVASKRHVVGLGLGLWIVRTIVEAHHGQVSVSSEPGVATTFTVTLPWDSGTVEPGQASG